VATFGNSAEARTVAHVRKYGGFERSDFFKYSGGLFETYRTLMTCVSSVSEYATSGWTRHAYALFNSHSDFLDVEPLFAGFLSSPPAFFLR
jgi:hypothetical protein